MAKREKYSLAKIARDLESILARHNDIGPQFKKLLHSYISLAFSAGELAGMDRFVVARSPRKRTRAAFAQDKPARKRKSPQAPAEK